MLAFKIIVLLLLVLALWKPLLVPLGHRINRFSHLNPGVTVVIMLVLLLTSLGVLLTSLPSDNSKGGQKPQPNQAQVQAQADQEARNQMLREEMDRLIRQSYYSNESNPNIRMERLKSLKEKFFWHQDARECFSRHTYEGTEENPYVRQYANQVLSDLVK